MLYLELLAFLVGVAVLPLAILLATSWKVQWSLLVLELPLLVWVTWQVAGYQR